jgi:hypothetical protein
MQRDHSIPIAMGKWVDKSCLGRSSSVRSHKRLCIARQPGFRRTVRREGVHPAGAGNLYDRQPVQETAAALSDSFTLAAT